jgi:hypothetical protein
MDEIKTDFYDETKNYETEIVIYNGKQYNVTNPGILLYSKTKCIRGSRVDRRPEIVDQLDGCSEIEGFKSRGVRKEYLKNRYGLTDFDYFMIVYCKGDESKLPKCTYVNPYTGEKCNKPKKFRSLTPGKAQRTGKRLGIFHTGCEEHANNAAAQIAQRENYKRGVTGLQKADRNSKVWREKLRIHALKQMDEGRSIFSKDQIRDENIPSVKEFSCNPSITFYKGIAIRLSKDETISVENCIELDREVYIRRGNPDDVCYYYLSKFNETDKYFKLGVTINLENRAKTKDYHGYTYDPYSMKELFSADRITIANLEYDIKIKFKDKISLGNEGFLIEDLDEIMLYIEERINYYKSKQVVENTDASSTTNNI